MRSLALSAIVLAAILLRDDCALLEGFAKTGCLTERNEIQDEKTIKIRNTIIILEEKRECIVILTNIYLTQLLKPVYINGGALIFRVGGAPHGGGQFSILS